MATQLRKEMTLFEKQNNFGVEFTDDIVQDIFSKDSSYPNLYNKELQNLYQSVQDPTFDKVFCLR